MKKKSLKNQAQLLSFNEFIKLKTGSEFSEPVFFCNTLNLDKFKMFNFQILKNQNELQLYPVSKFLNILQKQTGTFSYILL